VVDDTDFATRANIEPVYRLFDELGMRTTKTVWPLEPTEPNPYDGAETAQNLNYRAFLRDLQEQGFEIALHGVTMHSSPRAVIERGLTEFAEIFGGDPSMHINHFKNLDNVYWGRARLSGMLPGGIYRAAAGSHTSLGHIEDSDFFWGDICRDRINYVRGFTFRATNLDEVDAPLVYRDSERPYANRLFSSTEGGDLVSYMAAIIEGRQDALERDGGVCIMYTHFGAGFVENGQLNPEFERLTRRLAEKGGWFPTATELLDHLDGRDAPVLTPSQRRHLEWGWLRERLRYGSS
jgi:hypothetical protein